MAKRHRAGVHRRRGILTPWWITLALTTTVLVVGLCTVLFWKPISQRLAQWTAQTLTRRLQTKVNLSGIRFTDGFAPCFENFEIYRYQGPFEIRAAAPSACLRNWYSAVTSLFHATEVALQQPTLAIRPRPRNVRAPQPPQKKRRAKTKSSILRELTLTFDDLRIDWLGLPLPTDIADGSIGPIGGKLIVQQNGPLKAMVFDLFDPRSGAEINGRIAPTRTHWDVAAGLQGDVVSLLGEFLTTDDVRLLSLPSRGTLGARWFPDKERLVLNLELAQSDVDFESTYIARNRLIGLSARQRAVVIVDLARRRLKIEGGILEVNDIPIEIDVDFAPRRKKQPEFKLEVRLRTTPLVELLRSIPGTEMPEFARRVSPDIQFAAQLNLEGIAARPKTWVPTFDYRFTNLENGPTGLELLKVPFEFFPLQERGRSKTPIEAGPGSVNWLYEDEIPYLLRRSIIVSEDATFPFHRGIEPAEIQAALVARLSGRRLRGGSTITQQLAKNLFLTRDRTALRKLQEALLACLMEKALGKDRIFELYVNLIEWGPQIYGIRQGSLHYFGVDPEDLSPLQAAYLASIIPSPNRFHRHYLLGKVPKYHRRRVDKLLRRLNRLGQLSDAELAETQREYIYFAHH